MNEIIRATNHALDMAGNRLKWYSITGNESHIRECKEWQEIAGMYINKLIEENTNEKTVEI